MTPTRWVVAADSSRCRIFSQPKRFGPLQELEDLVHAPSRLKDSELVTDRPGRTFDSAGAGRHAKQPSSEPSEEEARRFSRRVAERLDEARSENVLRELVLVAEPRFLGHLRGQLSKPTRDLVSSEISANLTRADPEEIRAKLREAFESR